MCSMFQGLKLDCTGNALSTITFYLASVKRANNIKYRK